MTRRIAYAVAAFLLTLGAAAPADATVNTRHATTAEWTYARNHFSPPPPFFSANDCYVRLPYRNVFRCPQWGYLVQASLDHPHRSLFPAGVH